MSIQTRRRRKNNTGKTRKNNHNKTVVCSPINEDNAGDYTCYSESALISMRDAWNIRRPDAIIESNDPSEIWNFLYKHMSNSCSTEKCWIRHKFLISNIDEDVLQYTFAPDAPKSWNSNPREWLSSYDIEQVMDHYEHAFPSFIFIGPSPIDFDKRLIKGECVWNELCAFNIQNHIKRGKTKIGIIFNTDPHNKSGEHWISMFIDITSNKPYVFFFDSTGDPPPNEVKTFSEKVIKQALDLGIDMKYHQNHPFEHQKGNTECGVYSLYMITQILHGEKSPEHFKKERITDKEMEKMRKYFFNLEG